MEIIMETTIIMLLIIVFGFMVKDIQSIKEHERLNREIYKELNKKMKEPKRRKRQVKKPLLVADLISKE